MARKANTVYVEVEWDLTSDDGPTPSMARAGVSRIVGIPASEFNDRLNDPDESLEWVADWLSDEYDWLVTAWCFA